jgi:hypothetical protein
MGTQTPFRARFGIESRVVTLSSSSNLTAVNSDTTDIGIITLSENTTFQNPIGSPTNGQLLQIRITSASSQAISFGTDYQAASGLALPSATTGGGAEDYIAFRWNATDSKWDMIGTTIGQLAAVADGSITAPKLSGAQTGSAPIFGVRAWVNFNGTGTVTINGSGNVSSITDNGTGDYTINFTTAMPSANYAVSLQTTGLEPVNQDLQAVIAGTLSGGATLKSTTQLRIHTGAITAVGLFDAAEISVTITG